MEVIIQHTHTKSNSHDRPWKRGRRTTFTVQDSTEPSDKVQVTTARPGVTHQRVARPCVVDGITVTTAVLFDLHVNPVDNGTGWILTLNEWPCLLYTSDAADE